MPDGFEPLALIDALNRHGVQYVIVGGWGAIQHGALRATNDLDICPQWSPENLERLGQVLAQLRAELFVSATETIPVPIIDGRLISQMHIGNWSTTAGRVDVLQGIGDTGGEIGYDVLRVRATTASIGGHTVAVADLEDIVRSKVIADRPKDHDALPELHSLLSRRAEYDWIARLVDGSSLAQPDAYYPGRPVTHRPPPSRPSEPERGSDQTR